MERLHALAGHVAAHSFVGPSPAAPASSSSSADAATRVENAADPVKAVSGRGSETAPGALKAALESGQLIDATATSTHKVSDVLPGPLQDQDREELLLEMQKASSSGQAHTQWMEWQEHYGDNGLSSNIVVPHLLRERNKDAILTEKVLLSDPDDCIRIARAHTQKEPNFQMFMGDSVISATDNTVWSKQRKHMVEAFLPTSSLSHIYPISNDRASVCVDILKQLSQAGEAKVNMTEFFLNETQQQLHLALFGQRGEDYDEDKNAVFRDALGGPPGDDRYVARHKQAVDRMKSAQEREQAGTRSGSDDTSFLAELNKFIAKGGAEGDFAAPSDVAEGRRAGIAGPLSAVLATQMGNSNQVMPGFDQMPEETQKALNQGSDMGNAFIYAFAGHDTTGHTLTWLTYELAKNPEIQERVVAEVDAFWVDVGEKEPEFLDMKRLPFLTKCIMETLRLWPVVPNGTFRQLSYDDEVKGPGGKMVKLPKGTLVQVTTVGRHRSKELWGPSADAFDPDRAWEDDEIWHNQVYAARNPHSRRFSPFTHTPRDCIGKNFAQMEMRTILTQLFRSFTFELTDDEKTKASELGNSVARGKNNGTMGPMDVDFDMPHKPYGMHVYAKPRHDHAGDWKTERPSDWPEARGIVPAPASASKL